MVLDYKKLKHDSVSIRKEIIDIAASKHGCHIGGSLSVTDLLNYIFDRYNDDPRSQIVLSKGHAAAALYATLYVKDVIQDKPSLSYGQSDSLLLGHPNDEIKGIPYSTGSLGHGLGYGAGWALGQRLRHIAGLSIVIGGDGELQEGSVWESLQVVSAKHINNLVYVIDRNKAQNDGYVNDISPYYDLSMRFQSYRFQVLNINGHNFNEIDDAFSKKAVDKPTIIIANTVKGKGIKVM